MTLTKQYRVVWTGTTIVNADWQNVQTGFTWPGDGLSSFESDNFADVQALVNSLGLALPPDSNSQ